MMPTSPRARVLIAAAALTLVATAGVGVAAAQAEPTAPVSASVARLGGMPLNVRSGPSTTASVVRTVGEGQRVTVQCQTRGTPVNNDLTGLRSDLWDYVPELGGYVADAWMWTGPDGGASGQVAPSCGARGTLDGGVRLPTRTPSAKPTQPSTGGTLPPLRTVPGSEVTQDFGPADFAQANCGLYAYGKSFGLSGCQHPGLDLGAPRGSQVLSPVSGTVVAAGGTGFFVDDEANRMAPGAGELRIRRANGDEVILGHLSSIKVALGSTVQAGQDVGAVGYVTGSHVHLEYRTPDASLPYGMRIVDPRTRLS